MSTDRIQGTIQDELDDGSDASLRTSAPLSAKLVKSEPVGEAGPPRRKSSDLTTVLTDLRRRTPDRPAGGLVESRPIPTTPPPRPQGSGAPAASSPSAPAIPLDIIDHWKKQRGNRRWPSWSDFRMDDVIARWPDSVLLTRRTDVAKDASESQIFSVMRLGKPKSETNGASIAYSAGVSQWILSIAREAVLAGKPIKDHDEFPTPGGTMGVRLVALPMSDDQSDVTHVLCQLKQT